MVSWRARRQLAVIIVVLIPLVGLVFWLVPKFTPAPSCTDNKKNQGEEEVDCGGPCVPCELKHPKPITVFWTRAVPDRANTYDVAAEIQNPNQLLSSANVTYEFTLADTLGTVALKRGTTFILPQEKIHVIEANLSTTREPNRTEFRVISVAWLPQQANRPNFVPEARSYAVDDSAGTKQGVVTTTLSNRTAFDFRTIEVDFIVLNKDGNLMGANRVAVDNFISGTRRDVKSIWPQPLQGEIGTIMIEPRANVLDPAVIIKPH